MADSSKVSVNKFNKNAVKMSNSTKPQFSNNVANLKKFENPASNSVFEEIPNVSEKNISNIDAIENFID